MSVYCDQLSSRHQATGPRPWTAAGHNSPTKGCRVTAVTGSWLFKKIYMIKKTKKKRSHKSLGFCVANRKPLACLRTMAIATLQKEIKKYRATFLNLLNQQPRILSECDRQKVRPVTFQVLSRFPDCTYEVNHAHAPAICIPSKKTKKKNFFLAACNFEQRWGNISNMHERKTLQRVSACSHTVTGDLLIGTDTAGVPKCGNFISL